MKDEEPELFQHYRILRQPTSGKLWELGRGAMGVTYKALDTRLHVNVALKIINEHLFLEEAVRERFMREARAAASLFHRNVARVFYLGENGKNYFYAMEFIEGETLEALVNRSGPLTLFNALSIVLQVSRALAAAHHKNLVHRDIKPANIMLVDEFEERAVVKLIDFGLAKSVAEEGASLVNTNTAGFLGTPLYASPEQCDERAPDIRSDIYSLGITLWYLLTGTPPFTGSLGKVFSQHLHKAPPFEKLPGHIPPVVHTLLDRMLAKDPAHRPNTPTVLRHEIEECMRQVLTNLPLTPGSGADVALAEAANRVVSDLPGTTTDTELLSMAVGSDAPTAPVPLTPANTELLSMAVVTDTPPAPVLSSPPQADLLSMAVGLDAPIAPVPLSPPEADLLSMAAVAHASPTPIRLTDEEDDEPPMDAPPEQPPALEDTALTALLPAGTTTDFRFADTEAPTAVPDEPVISELTSLPLPPPEAASTATDNEWEPEELEIEPAEVAEVELAATLASDWAEEPEFDIPQVGSLLGGRYRLHQFIGEDETGRLFLAQSAADEQNWSTARIFHPEIADLAPEGYPELEMAYERLNGARHVNLLEMRELEVSGGHRFLVTAASVQDFSLLDVLRHRGNLTFRETISLARHTALVIVPCRKMARRSGSVII